MAFGEKAKILSYQPVNGFMDSYGKYHETEEKAKQAQAVINLESVMQDFVVHGDFLYSKFSQFLQDKGNKENLISIIKDL